MRNFEKISYEQWFNNVPVADPEFTYNEIKLPQRATSYSAGYDIYSPVSTIIPPGQVMKIPTGIKVQMDYDDVLLLFIRSSLGIKYSVGLANGTGVIDADYYNNIDNEGHIWLVIINNGSEDFNIKLGDRLVQGVFVKYETTENDTPIKNERIGGIGSTNKEREEI